MPASLGACFAELTARRAGPAARAWLSGAMASVEGPAALASLPVAIAGAGRRLGHAPVTLEPAEAQRLRAAGVAPLPEGWGLDACGRAALLLTGLGAVDPAAAPSLIGGLVRRGELREQEAVLRVLAYLPDPARFVDVATWACRTHVESVFRAIACDNPYPAAHFPELNFNQMVLKAIFIETPVLRIAGLERRAGPELARMAEGYASERRAAGRPVPGDVEIVLNLCRRTA